MARTKTVDSDLLGIAAFVSAVGNLVQADNQGKLRALYHNLLSRYRDVCAQYQTLVGVNQQLQQEILDLRAQNNRLQKEMTTKGAST